MVLADYEFQLTDTGVVLNSGVAVPFVDIERVSGLDSAPYRETIRDHEGTDGGFIDAEFETGREIILDGVAYCDPANVETYLDSLKANFAPSTSTMPLYLKSPNIAQRLVFVKPRGVRYDWNRARRTGITPVQFLAYAEDPRIYDDNLMNVEVPFGGVATTGFGFNFGFNLSFGVTIPPIGANVFNYGNRPAPAILTLTGPIVNPRIINETDSKVLEFSPLTLTMTDVLVIDLANRTVVLNGSVNRYDTLQTSDWFLFNPGDTFIKLGGGSGTGSLTVSLRNAWR